MADFTFPKAEKLVSKKLIAETFRKGNQYFSYPLKFFFLPKEKTDLIAPVQVLVSVPKKSFRKAVHRNKIKRQLKEVYRLNKNSIHSSLQDKQLHCCIAVIFIAKKSVSYSDINQAFLSFTSEINKLEISKP
ncbi:ribonuclease P protein component [Chondrinema litorale]|uniref:ribonuclease P protein component n=1 Tax=Chondrinema litorale TaxID=2994555 RepID=UPI00254303FE|nr:ribonuclease P protein component [Chondrinema litorale]UZR92426.1 ribonuclease P protein component [Chondrinema litorale]